MLVDVGAVYDPSRHRYDHHQREFHDSFSSDFHTRLSSAGLIYKHFGRDLLAQTIATFQPDASPSEESASLVEKAYWKVYKSFIEHIDANDNGIAVVEDGSALKYHVSTTLADRVGRLNLGWNEVVEGGDEEGEQERRFLLAMSITSAAFLDEVILAPSYTLSPQLTCSLCRSMAWPAVGGLHAVSWKKLLKRAGPRPLLL